MATYAQLKYQWAVRFMRHREIWRVKYITGGTTRKMNYDDAKAYAEIFGGDILLDN